MGTSRSNPQFLSGESIRNRLQALILEAEKIDAAVAYWGDGAVEQLGLKSKEKGSIRVICDARSGACNPKELHKLLSLLGHGQLKTLDGLHAKVYITQLAALVGSANASANGLGEEGAEIKNTFDACLVTQEVSALSTIEEWFEEHWRSHQAEVIDARMLFYIERLWQERRRGRPTRSTEYTTLLAQIYHEPEFFKDRRIRLVLYEYGEISIGSKRTWEDNKDKHYHDAELEKFKKDGVLPIYEDLTKWPVHPNDIVIDFYLEANMKKPMFGGMWRVRGQNAFVPIEGEREARLILLEKISRPFGFCFPKKEQDILRTKLGQFVSESGKGPDKHGNILDVNLDLLPEILRDLF